MDGKLVIPLPVYAFIEQNLDSPAGDMLWKYVYGLLTAIGTQGDIIRKLRSRVKRYREASDRMYDIERVIRKRVKRGKPEYLVKWEGYEAPSWVALDDMDYRTGRGLDRKNKKKVGKEIYLFLT